MSIRRSRVWVADDDPSVRSHLADLLIERGYDVQCLDSSEQVLHCFTSSPLPALLLLEIRLPRVSGLEILSALNKIGSRIPSIVLLRVTDIPTVVEAMRLGASDYLPKPIEAKDFEAAMARIMAANKTGLQARFSTSEATFQSSNCTLSGAASKYLLQVTLEQAASLAVGRPAPVRTQRTAAPIDVQGRKRQLSSCYSK